MKNVTKICINCPAGCHLNITQDDDGTVRTTGNQCPRGAKYALQEMTDPRRVVTAVVRSLGTDPVCIPVKSTEPVPKAKIPDLLKTLFSLRVSLPVRQGQVLLKDIQGTGISVIATRSFSAPKDYRSKKVLAFDLDGTLTQHKSPLSEETRAFLKALSERYRLVMVGAGACERIYRQMGEFPVEIIGCYGMQRSVIENGTFRLVENQVIPCPKDKIEAIAAALRQRFGLTPFAGDSVEYHASGSITFPILGTQAILADKLAYDPDRSKRRILYPAVCEAFAGYTVFIGGSSSFDITPPGYDKYHALERFCRQNDLSLNDVLYIGDDFGDGGNDSHIRLGGMDYLEITDYRTTPQRLAFLLA